MATINISLPTQLKNDAEMLVSEGVYVSFSDLVRDSIRRLLREVKYDYIYEKTKKDFKKGKALVINNRKDIDNYFKSI